MNMNWKAGSKVFSTEEEAKQYAKDMMARGAIAGICETIQEVTHEYIGPDGLTKEV